MVKMFVKMVRSFLSIVKALFIEFSRRKNGRTNVPACFAHKWQGRRNITSVSDPNQRF